MLTLDPEMDLFELPDNIIPRQNPMLLIIEDYLLVMFGINEIKSESQRGYFSLSNGIEYISIKKVKEYFALPMDKRPSDMPRFQRAELRFSNMENASFFKSSILTFKGTSEFILFGGLYNTEFSKGDSVYKQAVQTSLYKMKVEFDVWAPRIVISPLETQTSPPKETL